MSLIRCFLREKSGATAIEYSLIAAGISIVIVTAVTAVGGQLTSIFTSVSAQINGSR